MKKTICSIIAGLWLLVGCASTQYHTTAPDTPHVSSIREIKYHSGFKVKGQDIIAGMTAAQVQDKIGAPATVCYASGW